MWIVILTFNWQINCSIAYPNRGQVNIISSKNHNHFKGYGIREIETSMEVDRRPIDIKVTLLDIDVDHDIGQEKMTMQ